MYCVWCLRNVYCFCGYGGVFFFVEGIMFMGYWVYVLLGSEIDLWG